jgi:hypothetical protein
MADQEYDSRLESLMDDIYEIAVSLVPERMERGEWLPVETERAIGAFHDKLLWYINGGHFAPPQWEIRSKD